MIHVNNTMAGRYPYTTFRDADKSQKTAAMELDFVEKMQDIQDEKAVEKQERETPETMTTMGNLN